METIEQQLYQIKTARQLQRSRLRCDDRRLLERLLMNKESCQRDPASSRRKKPCFFSLGIIARNEWVVIRPSHSFILPPPSHNTFLIIFLPLPSHNGKCSSFHPGHTSLLKHTQRSRDFASSSFYILVSTFKRKIHQSNRGAGTYLSSASSQFRYRF
jgi:hypothetical protein